MAIQLTAMSWTDVLGLRAGAQIGTSRWKPVTQDRIDLFAEATDDFQFVHVDPDRAMAETPFGGTIAHGFLTLSLVSSLAAEVMPASTDLNAVFLVAVNNVKFQAPLRAGRCIRGVFVLDRLAWLSKTRAVARIRVIVEIEGEQRPAVICDVSWLVDLVASAAAGPDPVVAPERAFG